MGDKKGTVVPNKKNITKPKFFPVFIGLLALLMLVNMIPVVFILRDRKVDVMYIEYKDHLDREQSVEDMVEMYYSADDEKDKEKCFNSLRYLMYRSASEEKSQYAVYFGNEKVLETTPGYFACAVISENPDEMDDTWYVLEDQSYLEPLLKYKNGKYDHEKNAGRKDKYSLYRYEEELDLQIGDIPKMYDVNFLTIYVNEEKQTFIPGKIEVFDYYSLKTLDVIDCTPADTKGYELVESFYKDDEDFLYISNPSLFYVESYTEGEVDTQTFSDSGALGTEEHRADYRWTLDYNGPDFGISYSELYKVLPLTTIFIHAAAFVLALAVALVISVIIYNRRKTTWEIFEYRKKTTAAMAHDLKTPLAAMAAYAENLEYDINSEKRAYYSAKIRENIDCMSKTVEGILDFSKSETGTIKTTQSDIDVRELIQKEVTATSEIFKKNNITVDVKGEGKVNSSKDLLEQSVRNLISNAAKYARPGTTVDIAIDGTGFTITNLTDQKIADPSKLKEPFVKGEESRGSENGTGLGLSIADNSLAAAGHKLDISVEGDTFKAVVRW